MEIDIVELTVYIPVFYEKSRELQTAGSDSSARKGDAQTFRYQLLQLTEVADTGDAGKVIDGVVSFCQNVLQNLAGAGAFLTEKQIFAEHAGKRDGLSC